MERKSVGKKLDYFVSFITIIVIICWILTSFVKPINRFYLDIIWKSFLPLILVYSLTRFLSSKVNNKDIQNVIGWVRVILIIVLLFFMSFDLLPMYIDIPNSIIARYKSIEGEITKVKITEGRYRKQYFTLNEIEFYVDYHDFNKVDEGNRYEVTFLSNSKYVIDLKRIYK